MDKFFFVIGYTSEWGRHDESGHFTEIIFCEDGEPLIRALKAIIKKGECLDSATSQYSVRQLDKYLIKLYPDGRQEKILIKIKKKHVSEIWRSRQGNFHGLFKPPYALSCND